MGLGYESIPIKRQCVRLHLSVPLKGWLSLKRKLRVTLGLNVNRLRQAREMTQEELAELAEIDRRYVQRIERGTANPGIEIVGRLREVFDVGWSDLLG